MHWLRESGRLEKLPDLDTKGLRDPLNRRQADSHAPAGLDVLKVPRPQPCPLGSQLLAPSAGKPGAPDVRAKGGSGRHPLILGSCDKDKHAT